MCGLKLLVTRMENTTQLMVNCELTMGIKDAQLRRIQIGDLQWGARVKMQTLYFLWMTRSRVQLLLILINSAEQTERQQKLLRSVKKLSAGFKMNTEQDQDKKQELRHLPKLAPHPEFLFSKFSS